MKKPSIWLIPLLLAQFLNLKAEILPRKQNLVSGYLNKVLDSLYTQLNSSKILISEINLGEEIGKFTDVEISAPGKTEKFLDGVSSFGFKLETNLTKVVIEGHYDIMYLDVPQLFPVFGKGKFSIILDVVNLNTKFTAVQNITADKFDVDIPDFQIFIQNSKVEFENLMNDIHLADFLNQLLSKLLPKLVEVSKPLIKAAMPIIDYYTNGIIVCIKQGIWTGTTEKCIKELFFKELINVIADESKLSINLSKFIHSQY